MVDDAHRFIWMVFWIYVCAADGALQHADLRDEEHHKRGAIMESFKDSGRGRLGGKGDGEAK